MVTWLNLMFSLPLPLKVTDQEAERLPSNHNGSWFSWWPVPKLKLFKTSTMINHISITKILLYHSRNYSAVWSSLPGIRGKNQVYLLQHRFSTTNYSHQFSSVQVAQSCLCDAMNSGTSGLPVHHQLPEFTQIHVHRIGY